MSGFWRVARAAAALLAIAAIWGTAAAQVRRTGTGGIHPEASVLLVSAQDGQAQIRVRNEANEPLLLYTTVYDVAEDKSLHLVALPPLTRVEPGAGQIVRFVLESPPQALAVQHYKRVAFEGIPPEARKDAGSRVRLNVRYDLPVIISPADLAPEESPWRLLKWTLGQGQLRVHNPSAYVVRLSQEVDLLPSRKRMRLLPRTYILPGETLAAPLTAAQAAGLAAVRLFPATLYGYVAADYDAPVTQPAAAEVPAAGRQPSPPDAQNPPGPAAWR